jgi:glycosyltransferase involved in cell wall biosynthesis
VVRVLHVINGAAIGGAERLLLSLLARHDRASVDTTVCNTFFGDGPFVEALRNGGHRTVSLPGRASFRAASMIALRLAAHLRRERYDVVHMHLVHSSIVGELAARLGGARVAIVTRHYTEEGYAGKGWLLRKLDALAARAATRVVAVSGSVRNHLIANGVPADRITVIYNGIDLAAIDRAIPPHCVHDGGGVHLGAVGSLTARKGHATLLRAFAKLPAHLDARLTIVGEGPEREHLQSLIATLGLGGRVELAGYRSDVCSLLREIDVYVQASLQESFGIAVLEALAARRAVVASNTGGIPEIITDEESGLLVPPDDAEALTAALTRLASDAALRRRLADGGRARVEAAFTIEETARRYEALYRELVERDRSVNSAT